MMRGVRCKARRGAAFVAICAALAMLIAFAGLGVDVGRMMVEHRALRTRAKAAALRAALAIDGTAEGLEKARRQAGAGSGLAVEKVEFASSAMGPWAESPEDPTAAAVARVTLRSEVELTLIRAVFSGNAKWLRAAASAQTRQDGVELVR